VDYRGMTTCRPAVRLRLWACPSTTPPGLLKWVYAMVNYYGVARGVEPKRKKARIARCMCLPWGLANLRLPAQHRATL
jgi:hypothetical protein